MNQSPPELFPQRPTRSDFGRTPSYRTRRIITILVLLLVLGGAGRWVFGMYYPSHPGEIPTIKADNTSWKQKPEQPGGLDIPHQDVEVYQALDNKDAPKPEVEHLLPPPEVPQVQAAIATTVNKTIATTVSNAPPQPPVGAPAAALQTENLLPPPANEVPASVIPTTVDKQSATQETIQPVKPAPQVPQAEKKKPAGKADRIIQLASVQDETAAKDVMSRLRAHYASILGDTQLHLVQADLGDKGIYYRIQSQPISDERANKICASMKKLNAGCILVRK